LKKMMFHSKTNGLEVHLIRLGRKIRIGPAAPELAHLCGGLPLAMRLVGSALAERPDRAPGAYARHLAEGVERLGPVDAALAASYGLLGAGLRRLWRLLAVFPGTFDAAAAFAVWSWRGVPARIHSAS
jgi:hypothetical protein